MRPHIPRTNVGVAVNDMNILHLNSELFGHDLSNDGVRALPHIRSTGKKIDFTEIVHFNHRSATI